MKNNLNMWPAKARLSTTVYRGERSELTKVQQRFEQVETVVDESDYFALLPVGCWSMNNVGGIYTINLHSNILHSIGCQYMAGFSGRSAQEAARKAAEYVQRIGGEG